MTDAVQENVTVVNVAQPQQGWGIYTGRTLGAGGAAVLLEGGWPGFLVGGIYGITPKIDVGVKVDATYTGLSNYAVNGLTPRFGMDFRLVGRFSIFEQPSFALSTFVEPGWHIPEFIPGISSGPSLVTGIVSGIRVVRGGAIYLGVDVAFYLQVSDPRPTTFFSVLPGAGYELHVKPWIGFGARVNAGPLLVFSEPTAATSATAVDFDIQGTFYVVLRINGER
jgi:hypothetical protein